MSTQKKYGEDAGQQYDKKVEEFAKSGKVEKAADEARRSIENPKGEKEFENSIERGRVGRQEREH